MTFSGAINHTLAQIMAEDEDVVVMGDDVHDPAGQRCITMVPRRGTEFGLFATFRF